jgi:hypothetical protein
MGPKGGKRQRVDTLACTGNNIILRRLLKSGQMQGSRNTEE